MKLLELYLKSFGSFTERRIELPDAGGPGLCVLYGANEAGKSTALRAIRGLLYGIPPRSPDDFIHRYADLRIGARLRFDDGEELAVMRRKKPRLSLYTYDDSTVLEDSRIEKLAEEVPEPLFERFYGLDHRTLSQGSEALLADEGDVGRALFGAGLGLANLGPVLDGLEAEASELFAPRANTRRINAAITAWKETQKEIKSLALDPKQWQAQETQVREAEEGLEALNRRVEEARMEQSRLERIRRALPALAKRRNAQRRLGELADVATLSDDFERRLSETRAGRDAAGEARRRAIARIERESAVMEGLSSAPQLIAERDRVEAIHQQVEGVANAAEQLPRREAELARIEREIDELLARTAEVDTDRIASLHAGLASAGRIRMLASEAAKFEDRVVSARSELEEAGGELARQSTARDEDGAEVSSERDAEVEVDRLQLALQRAVKLGAIDDRIRTQTELRTSLERDLLQRSRRLGIDYATLEKIEEIPFPAHDLIDSTGQRFSELGARRESLRDEVQRLRTERSRIAEALSVIRTQGAVPKPEDLESIRGERDEIWRALRKEFVDSTAMGDPEQGQKLADRFEQESSGADELADRLRSDAKRVAEQGTLEARRARVDRDLSEVAEREAMLEADIDALTREWRGFWSKTGIEAEAPEAMRGWRREFDELKVLRVQEREARDLLDRDATARAEAIDSIRVALRRGAEAGSVVMTDERLDEWIAQAEAVIERRARADSLRRSRREAIERAKERQTRAERQLDQAAAALEEWSLQWNEAIASLNLKAGSRPQEALDRIEAMQALLERFRERDQLADRVEKMGRDVGSFERSVADLVAGCAPTLADQPPTTAILRLHRMLGDSLNEEVLRRKCAGALAEAREERKEAEARLESCARTVEALCQDAGVQAEAGLDEALRRWRAFEDAVRSRDDAEAELENLAEGQAVAELEAQSADVHPDAVSAQIETLGSQIRALVEDQADTISNLRSQRDLLERMDGSGRVGELAAAAESQLAAIRTDVERFVQLRMARQILEREVKQYREDHQAPLLQRTSEIFQALSEGAYPRVSSQVADDGVRPHLVALSATGTEVPVGGLSAGTRDQLFLALRLASLEESVSRGESMPLIADDILIEFDDERTRASLEVLAEVARKTQIFLFSHHRHVADIASDLGSRAAMIEL